MIKTSWDFQTTLGFKSLKDPKIKKELKLAKLSAYKFINRWSKDNSYLTSTKSLLKALSQYDQWVSHFSTAGQVDYYLSLRQALNENSSQISAKLNKLSFVSKKIENDIQFFPIKLSKVSPSKQTKFLKSPALKPYRNFLKNLFAHGQHILSNKEEKLLNLKSQVSYSNWVKMTSRLLSQKQQKVLNHKGKLQTLPFSKIGSLIDNRNFKIAKSSGLAFTSIVNSLSDVAESELNSILENKFIEDNIRHYKRPDSARHLSDDIDTSVVDSLVDGVSTNFQVSKDFYKFKARLLGIKKIPYFWRNVPTGRFDKSFSPTLTIDLIDQVFNNLDPLFSALFKDFLQNGQIDFLSKKGKSDGAFCAGGLLSSKSFILLNHNNKLRDVTTLAHEMGHAINNELMRTSQNGLNFDTSLAIAEVASTFFEDFVLDYIASTLTSEERFSLLMAKLDDDISTIFRQVACYNFETELHTRFRKIGYLSKKQIGDLFIKHMSSYMGDSIDLSGFDAWWVYWSHIRNPFYVYSYASGLLISKYLQSKVNKDPVFINQVKKVLSSGTSRSPKQIFASIGLDLEDRSFWSKGIEQVQNLIEEAQLISKSIKIRKSAV